MKYKLIYLIILIPIILYSQGSDIQWKPEYMIEVVGDTDNKVYIFELTALSEIYNIQSLTEYSECDICDSPASEGVEGNYIGNAYGWEMCWQGFTSYDVVGNGKYKMSVRTEDETDTDPTAYFYLDFRDMNYNFTNDFKTARDSFIVVSNEYTECEGFDRVVDNNAYEVG